MDFLLFTLTIATFGTLFFVIFVGFAIRIPDVKAALYMAGAYFFGVATLGLYSVYSWLQKWHLHYSIEASLWLGTLLTAMALAERVGWKPRWWINAAIFAIGLLLLISVQRPLTYVIMDIAQAAVLLQTVGVLYKNKNSVINKISFWFVIVSIAFLTIRATSALLDIYPIGFASTQQFHLALTILSTAIFGLIAGNIICFSIAYDLVQKHSAAAMTDPLTGLLNRRGMAMITNDRYTEGKERALDGRAVLIFDIDNFKAVNDTYGHDIGDEVLVKIAATVADLIKYHGHCARTGGEEFSVLFSKASSPAAFVVAEHLRVALGLIMHDGLHANTKITVSMGLAFIREGEAFKRAARRADAALYAAKDAGRNRLRIADGDILPDADNALHLPEMQISALDQSLKGLG